MGAYCRPSPPDPLPQTAGGGGDFHRSVRRGAIHRARPLRALDRRCGPNGPHPPAPSPACGGAWGRGRTAREAQQQHAFSDLRPGHPPAPHRPVEIAPLPRYRGSGDRGGGGLPFSAPAPARRARSSPLSQGLSVNRHRWERVAAVSCRVRAPLTRTASRPDLPAPPARRASPAPRRGGCAARGRSRRCACAYPRPPSARAGPGRRPG